MPGVGYVAVSRVKHFRKLVFDVDLPAWETFQEACHKARFRSRRRFELRLQARFSRTLRKYGFCEADPWTREEAAAAEELLKGLRAKGQLQRAAISHSGKPCDEDAHIWPDGEPSFDALLGKEVKELGREDASRVTFLAGVAQRLRGELHMPAVREARGCLIPEKLHGRLDDKKARGVKGDVERVGVHLEAGRWTVDVSAEGAIAMPGRAMSDGVLEFSLRSSAESVSAWVCRWPWGVLGSVDAWERQSRWSSCVGQWRGGSLGTSRCVSECGRLRNSCFQCAWIRRAVVRTIGSWRL